MSDYHIIQQHKPFTTEPPLGGIMGFSIPVSGWYTSYKDPNGFKTEDNVRELFKEIIEHKGVSDISICPGYPVMIKIKGRGVYAVTHTPITHLDAETFSRVLTGSDSASSNAMSGVPMSGQAIIYNHKIVNHDISFKEDIQEKILAKYRYEVTGVCSPVKSRTFNIILRPLGEEPPDWDAIELEDDFCQACMVTEGLVVLAAGTAQGKTTTIGAVTKRALKTDPDDPNFKVVSGYYYTHEDPIENDFTNVRSNHSVLISSEIGGGGNINNFLVANRSAMRRSPDYIIVGELRDEETISSAIELAIAGCGVMATTHANNIATIMPRLVTRFPPSLQSQKASDLLQTLAMLASQRLIWVNDLQTGKLKRKSIREYLILTPELKDYLSNYIADLPTLYKKIEKIVDNNLFGVNSFTKQAKEMLARGEIDDKTYHFLSSEKQKISDDVLRQLGEI